MSPGGFGLWEDLAQAVKIAARPRIALRRAIHTGNRAVGITPIPVLGVYLVDSQSTLFRALFIRWLCFAVNQAEVQCRYNRDVTTAPMPIPANIKSER